MIYSIKSETYTKFLRSTGVQYIKGEWQGKRCQFKGCRYFINDESWHQGRCDECKAKFCDRHLQCCEDYDMLCPECINKCQFYDKPRGRYGEKHLIQGKVRFCWGCRRRGCSEHFEEPPDYRCCGCYSHHP